jgi:hypothetical protein
MNKACSILLASIVVAPSADAMGLYEKEVRAIFNNIEKNKVVIECQTLVNSDVAVMFESGFKSDHIVIDPGLLLATRDKRVCERRVAFVSSSSSASQKDKAAVLLGLIYVGMREAAALASWGRPKSTNKYDSGKTQRWLYDNKVSPTTYYIYLKNGVVMSWQSTE